MTMTMDRPATEPSCAIQDGRYLMLAEAMHRGAALGPQCFGHMFMEPTMGSCALGAIVLGLGGTPHSPPRATIRDLTDFDVYHVDVSLPKEIYAQIPAHKHATYMHPWWLSDAIMLLNDCFRWERERIADWVASLATSKENA